MADDVVLSRRDRNKQRTRARILDTARALFGSKGVADVTIEELADAADVARATFFNYFPTKAAVVDEILDDLDLRFYRLLDHTLARDISTATAIEALFSGSAKSIESDPQFFRIIIAESEKSLATVATDNHRYRVMIDQFRKIVDRGIARGDVRRDQPADLLAEILAGTYTSILRTWRGRPSYKLVVRLKKAARLMGEFLAPPER